MIQKGEKKRADSDKKAIKNFATTFFFASRRVNVFSVNFNG
jgi:hypothetical protein